MLNKVKSQPPALQALLVILSLLPLYYGSYQYHVRHPYGNSKPTKGATPPVVDFVREWLDVQVVDPFSPSAIATYCNRTVWHPNLVFNLANANGGIGNVRGNMLDFLFFALEAGASIILPGMASRSQEDITNVWAARAPFDEFFDGEWFLLQMGLACPQMAIYKPEGNQTMAEALPGNYLPKSRRMDEDPGNTKEIFLKHLEVWLEGNPKFDPNGLTLVNLERTLWDVDTRSLPQGFRRNFGQLLRINATIRRIAAVVVQEMQARFQLRMHPWDTIPHRAFYGAHLRTEADAQNAGWLSGENANFSAQTDAYIEHALKSKLGVIYVASGNATDLAAFQEKAAAHKPPLNVTSKFDLLPISDAASLRALSWDQQALVDYEVLQRCSTFSGVVKSSFSYNIALARNQWLEDQGRVIDPWYVMHKETGVAFDDGVSRVLGRDEWHEHRIPRGMWP